MDMNTGFLYFDNNQKLSMLQKILNAQANFEKKFNHKAEYCLVNRGDAENIDLETISKTTKLIVRTYRFVMPKNFWVGFEGMDVRERV